MKKIFIAIMLLFATNITTMYADDPVILNPTGSDPFQGNKHRTLTEPIYAYYEGFTLTFDTSCIGCPVTLLDEDENIVFTAVVNAEGIVNLPDTLSGTFELQLERGGIIFVGEIVL